MDWSRIHQCHVSADDINLLVETINTEHEEIYKAAIDGKEYIRDTCSRCSVMPCDRNAGQRVKIKIASASYQSMAKSTTFEGTYEV